MAADSKGFDYVIGGEPLQFLCGKASTGGFDYVLAGEPYQALYVISSQPPATDPRIYFIDNFERP